jgi:hypothetical protein
MSRTGVLVWSVVGVIVLSASSSSLRAATPQQVDKAIKKGVDWLYSQQNDKGNWEGTPGPGPDARKEQAKPEGGQWGGHSAIATYALLDAGESWRDKRVRDALEWLNRAPMIGTYAVALRAQCWQYLPQSPGVKSAAQRDCGMLLNGMKSKGDARGMWAYLVSDGNSQRYDHSTTQIALLGVWAANQAGREVPIAFWRESETAWRNHQNTDGGWGYIYKGENEQGKSKMSMTLAGVATLFIAQDYVHANDGINCRGNSFDDRLVVGTRWIRDNITEGVGGGYALYGMERVGIASGFKYFGDYDWYARGADHFVRGQKADGSWGNGSIPETAFAVIFLSRGRAPVIINKFEYELEGKAPPAPKPVPVIAKPAAPVRPAAQPKGRNAPVERPADPPPPPPEPEKRDNDNTYEANWSQRPRDVALFTRWMTDVTERKLNWQIVSNRNGIDDLHDAPVLFMAGNQRLALPKETVDKLRQYIEEGGLLFGHADCASKEFTESFVALGKQLFPAYEFRELPADHPIYTRQQYLRKNWKNPPSVIGLSNGARELMITLPGSDIARNWQQGNYNGKEETFQVMNGIVLYAVDRQNLRLKGGSHVVRVDPKVAEAPATRTIKLARLEFPGNWNPEPAGWRRMSAILRNQKQGQVEVEAVKLGDGKLDAATYPVAHLTGTARYTFTKDQVAELRRYVIKGGVILCDAAGGDTEFAVSAEAALGEIVTGAKLAPIPPDDAVLALPKGTQSVAAPMIAATPVSVGAGASGTTAPATPSSGRSLLPDLPPSTRPTTAAATQSATVMLPGNVPIEYRSFARARMSKSDALRLKGISFRGRWAIIYSAEDLSTGLVGQSIDGIHGYAPATATEIVRRIVLNSAPPPPPPPAKAAVE